MSSGQPLASQDPKTTADPDSTACKATDGSCDELEELKKEAHDLHDEVEKLHEAEESTEKSREKHEEQEKEEHKEDKKEEAKDEHEREEKIHDLLTQVRSLHEELLALEPGGAEPETKSHEESAHEEHEKEKEKEKQQKEKHEAKASLPTNTRVLTAARSFCEQLGYSTGGHQEEEHQEALSSHDHEELSKALDQLHSVQHDLDDLKQKVGESKATASASEPKSEQSSELSDMKDKLDRLDHRLTDLETEQGESEGGSKAIGRRVPPRSTFASSEVDFTGTIQAASSDRIVVRSDSGQLLLLDVSGETRIHKGDETKTAAELSAGEEADIRARREAGKLTATEVELHKSS